MKAKITINELNKARARALKYAKRMDGCSFSGKIYFFARISNALSRVGISSCLYSSWNYGLTERSYEYWLTFGFSIFSESFRSHADIIETDSDLKQYGKLHDLIVEACDFVADWIDENGGLTDKEIYHKEEKLWRKKSGTTAKPRTPDTK